MKLELVHHAQTVIPCVLVLIFISGEKFVRIVNVVETIMMLMTINFHNLIYYLDQAENLKRNPCVSVLYARVCARAYVCVCVCACVRACVCVH